MQKQFGTETFLLQGGDRIILSLIIVSFVRMEGGVMANGFVSALFVPVGLVLAMFKICYQGINLFAQLDETSVHGCGVVNSLNHYTHLNNKKSLCSYLPENTTPPLHITLQLIGLIMCGVQTDKARF